MQKEIPTPQEKLVQKLCSDGRVFAHYAVQVGMTDHGAPIVDGALFEEKQDLEDVLTKKEAAYFRRQLQQISWSKLYGNVIKIPDFHARRIELNELDYYFSKSGETLLPFIHGVDPSNVEKGYKGDGIEHQGQCITLFNPSQKP